MTTKKPAETTVKPVVHSTPRNGSMISDRAQAAYSEIEERSRRVELTMSSYKHDAANANAILWHILHTLTEIRVEFTDLIGSLRK